MLNGKIFTNSNGSSYDVIAVDFNKERAILRDVNRATDENAFIVAGGFRPNQDSWGYGKYDYSIGGAYQEFNKL